MDKPDFLQSLRDRDSKQIYAKHKSVSARLQGYTTGANQLEWERLKTFLSTSKGRSHFSFTKLDVYVRVTDRKLGGLLRPTVDISNVSAHETGQGHFKEWLSIFESLVQEQNKAIYIENVLTDQFAGFWERRAGYQLVDASSPDRCYWKVFNEETPVSQTETIFTVQDHLKEMGFESHKANIWHRGPIAVLLDVNGEHEMVYTPSPKLDVVFKVPFTNSTKSCTLALAQIRSEADKWFSGFQKEMREALTLQGKEIPKNLFEY